MSEDKNIMKNNYRDSANVYEAVILLFLFLLHMYVV